MVARSPPPETAVETCCLSIVARLGQRLPIVSIPEQHHVATVRDLVIDDLGHSGTQPALVAFGALAQWMQPQECSARLLPFHCVASSVRRTAHGISDCSVLCASAAAWIGQRLARWPRARPRCGVRHGALCGVRLGARDGALSVRPRPSPIELREEMSRRTDAGRLARWHLCRVQEM
jgi:hypothetical protein